MWADLFGKKDDDFNEFLVDPKILYNKIKEEVETLKAKCKSLTDTLDAERSDWADREEELQREKDELYEERDKLLERKDKLLSQNRNLLEAERNFKMKYDVKIDETRRELIKEYEELSTKAREEYKAMYRCDVAKKEAQLERDYHHEVHLFIEKQNDKFLEVVPSLVRETIIGFHNETASK